MKKIVIALLATFCFTGAFAQSGVRRGFWNFFDAGYQMKVSDAGESAPTFNYTAGYQFNPYFFLGGGVGIRYYTDAKTVALPVYADFHANLLDKTVTPFADVKLGYSPGDIVGFYGSFGVGCRFKVGSKLGLSLSTGYELQRCEVTVVSPALQSLANYEFVEAKTLANMGEYFIRFGLDF